MNSLVCYFSGVQRTEILCLKAWSLHQKGKLKIISMTRCWIFLAYFLVGCKLTMHGYMLQMVENLVIWLLAVQGFFILIHQPQWCIGEHKYSAIGRHLKDHGVSKSDLKDKQFSVLRKCRSKFDCLIFEMLFIKELKPGLNTQKDSVRAKLFTWHCVQLFSRI